MSICDRCKHYVVCEYVDENDGDTCDYFKMKSQDELLEDKEGDNDDQL